MYYLPCLAGTGLVAWLSDILNFYSGTCHLSSCPHPAPEKEQPRSRADVCKWHRVGGQEFRPGCWSTRVFDDSDCWSVLCNREWEESLAHVCSLLQSEGLASFTQSRAQNADMVLLERIKIIIAGWSGKNRAKQKFFSPIVTWHLFLLEVLSQSISTELLQRRAVCSC